jgi:hypothetical protein
MTTRLVVTLIAFTAAFGIYGLAVDSPFVSYYIPITIVVAGIVAMIHRAAHFSSAVLWGLMMVAFGNLAGGILLVRGQPLYVMKLVGDIRYDKPFHALATGVAAWACFEALTRWSGRSGGAIAFSALMLAAGVGSLVEIVEYIGSLIFQTTNVGDYGNNMLDLVANLIGAMIAVAICLRWRASHP